MGGLNYEWGGTPLKALYDKHTTGGKNNNDAVKAAGIDLGWILKAVLHEDKRTFEVFHANQVATYRWIGNEP